LYSFTQVIAERINKNVRAPPGRAVLRRAAWLARSPRLQPGEVHGGLLK